MAGKGKIDAERLLQNPPPQTGLFLLHGYDAGLVSERSRRLAERFVQSGQGGSEIVTLEGEQLAAEPGRLIEEANSIGLFAPGRVIHVLAGSGRKLFLDDLKALLSDWPDNCKVIVSASALAKQDALLALCARSPGAAAIECNRDRPEALRQLVLEEARANGQKLAQGALEAIVGVLGEDRLTTRSELSKLFLYAHGQAEIGRDDVEAIVAEGTYEFADRLVDLAFSGDLVEATTVIEKRLWSDLDSTFFVNQCLRHCLLLHRVSAGLRARRKTEHIFAVKPVPAIWRRDAVLAQARSWRPAELAALTGRLETFAFQNRLAVVDPRLNTLRAVWTIAAAARAARRRA